MWDVLSWFKSKPNANLDDRGVAELLRKLTKSCSLSGFCISAEVHTVLLYDATLRGCGLLAQLRQYFYKVKEYLYK